MKNTDENYAIFPNEIFSYLFTFFSPKALIKMQHVSKSSSALAQEELAKRPCFYTVGANVKIENYVAKVLDVDTKKILAKDKESPFLPTEAYDIANPQIYQSFQFAPRTKIYLFETAEKADEYAKFKATHHDRAIDQPAVFKVVYLGEASPVFSAQRVSRWVGNCERVKLFGTFDTVCDEVKPLEGRLKFYSYIGVGREIVLGKLDFLDPVALAQAKQALLPTAKEIPAPKLTRCRIA